MRVEGVRDAVYYSSGVVFRITLVAPMVKRVPSSMYLRSPVCRMLLSTKVPVLLGPSRRI